MYGFLRKHTTPAYMHRSQYPSEAFAIGMGPAFLPHVRCHGLSLPPLPPHGRKKEGLEPEHVVRYSVPASPVFRTCTHLHLHLALYLALPCTYRDRDRDHDHGPACFDGGSLWDAMKNDGRNVCECYARSLSTQDMRLLTSV
ncbi:hypothetical protein ColTof3_09847 [Colletotrichum tofieldiae]|nr:hypothetical protein ColTof3_09847 [Colletotrichum tofieldiae]